MNKIRFEKHSDNPIIKREPGTFRSIHAANPDIIQFRGRYLFYFRGQGDEKHDQMAVGSCKPEEFDAASWQMAEENPIIKVSPQPGDCDSAHVLDPAVVVVNRKVYLYYSAHSLDTNRHSSVALAVSEDGINFKKYPKNPLIPGIAPEIVYKDKTFYLFYERPNLWGQFDIFICPGSDYKHFSTRDERIVFTASGKQGEFDSFSISTVRIWKEGKWYYMAYGGCGRYIDYPSAIGLARSQDLLRWERYPGNPVMERGEPGSWDEGGLWFATVKKLKGVYYLWYEGCGTGMGTAAPEAIEASRKAREENYGGYAVTNFSQIGLAVFRGKMSW